jgi:hypothetical protein
LQLINNNNNNKSFLTSALDGGKWFTFTPLLLYPRGYNPRHLLGRRLYEPQNQYGCCGKGKRLFPLSEI